MRLNPPWRTRFVAPEALCLALLSAVLAISAVCWPQLALAQNAPASFTFDNGRVAPMSAASIIIPNGGSPCVVGASGCNLPVTGGSGGGGGGDASAANQTAVQANAGADATKATAVQGITGGKAIPVSAAALPLPTGAATNGAQTTAQASFTSIDAGIGGSAAAVAGSTGASNANGFLRFLRDVFNTAPASQATLASMASDIASMRTTQATMQADIATIKTATDDVAIKNSPTLAFTVQPGNTANTVPWLISGTVQPGNTANTTAWLFTTPTISLVASSVPTKADYLGVNSGGLLQGAVQADSAGSKIDTAASGTLQIIAGTSSQNIYITGFDFMAAGTTTYKLVYGTGTNCGTGTTDITGAYPLVAQAGVSRGGGLGVLYKIPSANSVCGVNTAAIQVSGGISSTKF